MSRCPDVPVPIIVDPNRANSGRRDAHAASVSSAAPAGFRASPRAPTGGKTALDETCASPISPGRVAASRAASLAGVAFDERMDAYGAKACTLPAACTTRSISDARRAYVSRGSPK